MTKASININLQGGLGGGLWGHTLISGVPREGYCFLTGESPVVVKAGAM